MQAAAAQARSVAALRQLKHTMVRIMRGDKAMRLAVWCTQVREAALERQLQMVRSESEARLKCEYDTLRSATEAQMREQQAAAAAEKEKLQAHLQAELDAARQDAAEAKHM